jgi:aspartate-semialdehyde dehydrogenase
MATPLESRRLVIAGASSLLGIELKSLLEEGRFAASDLRLVDEESAAGQLTETGGEPALIQTVEEDSFSKAWVVFFTGSRTFTRSNLALAKSGSARIIDLSGELAGSPGVQTWLPKFPGQPAKPGGELFAVPSAHAEIVGRLAAALADLPLVALSATAFQPVSDAGKPAIEELESQTGQLLSFQPLGKSVFDSQIAFNLLDRFGASSPHNLAGSTERVRKEVQALCAASPVRPAVQVLHAPVFYGAGVSAGVTLKPGSTTSASELVRRLAAAGFIVTAEDAAPSNVSVAGEAAPYIAPSHADLPGTHTWWFWAAADNLRVPATNAVKLAENFLESLPE